MVLPRIYLPAKEFLLEIPLISVVLRMDWSNHQPLHITDDQVKHLVHMLMPQPAVHIQRLRCVIVPTASKRCVVLTSIACIDVCNAISQHRRIRYVLRRSCEQCIRRSDMLEFIVGGEQGRSHCVPDLLQLLRSNQSCLVAVPLPRRRHNRERIFLMPRSTCVYDSSASVSYVLQLHVCRFRVLPLCMGRSVFNVDNIVRYNDICVLTGQRCVNAHS